jgi:hypothetical protein
MAHSLLGRTAVARAITRNRAHDEHSPMSLQPQPMECTIAGRFVSSTLISLVIFVGKLA